MAPIQQDIGECRNHKDKCNDDSNGFTAGTNQHDAWMRGLILTLATSRTHGPVEAPSGLEPEPLV